MTLDLGALLVLICLLWPAQRWRCPLERRRLLLVLYAAVTLQLIICALVMRRAARTESLSDLCADDASPASSSSSSPSLSGWMGVVQAGLEMDTPLLDALAASAQNAAANVGGVLGDQPGALLASPAEMVERGLVRFLQCASFFSHACLGEFEQESLAAAAAEESELLALLNVLMLPRQAVQVQLLPIVYGLQTPWGWQSLSLLGSIVVVPFGILAVPSYLWTLRG